MNETASPESAEPHGASAASEAAHQAEDRGDAGGARTGRRRSKPLIRKGGWLDYLVTIVVALVVAVLVKTFLIQPFYIPSESMVPTLEKNDKIVVSKLTPGVFPLKRGDVVVFEDPGNWVPEAANPSTGVRYKVLKALSYVGLSPDPAQDHLVKRLIGLPGDRVACPTVGGKLHVNGVAIDEPYLNPQGSPCAQAFDVTVPAGKLWMMGDNREHSADSAYHYVTGQNGFVPQSKVTGKAAFIMWPVGRWGTLGEGEKAFASVPAHP